MPARRPIDFVALRSIAPIRALTLHGWQWQLHCGDAYRGPCPFPACSCRHPRIFKCGPQVAYCYRCRRYGDALGLHAALSGLPTYEAALDLCERLALPVPYI